VMTTAECGWVVIVEVGREGEVTCVLSCCVIMYPLMQHGIMVALREQSLVCHFIYVSIALLVLL